jgi:hypothetical protein
MGVPQLFIDLKNAHDSLRISYNILIEFGVPMNLITLIKMCLNEMYYYKMGCDYRRVLN